MKSTSQGREAHEMSESEHYKQFDPEPVYPDLTIPTDWTKLDLWLEHMEALDSDERLKRLVGCG